MNAALLPLWASSGDTVAKRCAPGLRYGPAPQRKDRQRARSWLDRIVLDAGSRLVQRGNERAGIARSAHVAARVVDLRARADDDVQQGLDALGLKVRTQGHDEATLSEALAYAALGAERSLDQIPRAGQLQAADALLRSVFVEMPTGEGKTLATALAAVVASMDGTPVHVLTVNDYLAERDATQLAPLYAWFSRSSACVRPDMCDDERRTAYGSDIVHLTGKQIGFDWMRDALDNPIPVNSLRARFGALTDTAAADSRVREPLLRGLCLAIVDEADSLLIDEARTPLVLGLQRSGDSTAQQEAAMALALADMLMKNIDFRVPAGRRDVTLTPQGSQTISALARQLGGSWQATRYRDERVRQALLVRHLWVRDRDYVVRDDRVELVDEHTGRSLPDRRLQQGLHMLLEVQERCTPTPQSDIVASIACQRLFRQYARLAGTSGTLREVRRELSGVYDAGLTKVAPQTASRLQRRATLVVAHRQAQLDALILELEACAGPGRPVLVGTRSVLQSSGVSARLSAHDIPHALLSAQHEAEEASIVARAGTAGQITVATNMAGRGTDIPLDAGVAQSGGLHIVSLAFNDAARIDRQLAGRAARQGEPGSCLQIWSLDDPALEQPLPAALRVALQRLVSSGRAVRIVQSISRAAIRLAQRRIERRHGRQRKAARLAHDRIVRHAALGNHPDTRL